MGRASAWAVNVLLGDECETASGTNRKKVKKVKKSAGAPRKLSDEKWAQVLDLLKDPRQYSRRDVARIADVNVQDVKAVKQTAKRKRLL